MREIRFEYLRPRQILEAMKEKSIVYRLAQLNGMDCIIRLE